MPRAARVPLGWAGPCYQRDKGVLQWSPLESLAWPFLCVGEVWKEGKERRRRRVRGQIGHKEEEESERAGRAQGGGGE